MDFHRPDPDKVRQTRSVRPSNLVLTPVRENLVVPVVLTELDDGSVVGYWAVEPW